MKKTYKAGGIAETGEKPEVSGIMGKVAEPLYNEDGELHGFMRHFVGRTNPDADFTVAGVAHPGKKSRKAMPQEAMKSGGMVSKSRDGCAIRGKSRI